MSWPYPNMDTGNIPIGVQDTSHVAAEVLAEQTGDDIFNPPTPAEVVKIRTRLDVIQRECSRLFAELYPMAKRPGGGMSVQPEYERRADIQAQIDVLEEEERGLKGYLYLVYEGTDGDSGLAPAW